MFNMITPENACAFRDWMFKEFKIPVSLLSDGKGNITSLRYVYGIRWNKDPKYAEYSITNEITDKQHEEIMNKVRELFGEDYHEMDTISDGCPESIHLVTLQKMGEFKMDGWVPKLELNLDLKKDEKALQMI